MAPGIQKRRIAVPIGDPAGIGCEVALKALASPAIRESCTAVLVGDATLIERCRAQFAPDCALRIVASPAELRFEDDAVEVLHVPGLALNDFRFGVVAAANGRALIAYAEAAIALAQAGQVDCVVGAPHNETSVSLAGIPFSGYASLLARKLGMAEDEIYTMIASERFCIVHTTLHLALRDAIELIRRDRVLKTIRAADTALRGMGFPQPRLVVSGLNPHAGEGGLFGREEIDEIAPAVAMARAAGITVDGPIGADVMFARGHWDAYVVMIHDQGHIPGKLQPGSAGFCIGAPVLFASVAHGSAHDIAGKGVADPTNMINAIRWSVGDFRPVAGTG